MSFPLRREGAGGALDPDIPNLALDIANRWNHSSDGDTPSARSALHVSVLRTAYGGDNHQRSTGRVVIGLLCKYRADIVRTAQGLM